MILNYTQAEFYVTEIFVVRTYPKPENSRVGWIELLSAVRVDEITATNVRVDRITAKIGLS